MNLLERQCKNQMWENIIANASHRWVFCSPRIGHAETSRTERGIGTRIGLPAR